MTLFELLFILLFLASVCTLVSAAISALRRRGRTARRILATWGILAIAYLTIVGLVALRSPQRVFARGQDQCFDEMCFTIANLRTAQQLGPVKPTGIFYLVTVRVTSHSRGRTQGEGGLRATLWNPGNR